MKVRVKRQDYGDGFDIAVFETDAPPRLGEYLRFNDDIEALFTVTQVIYDLERFGPRHPPDVIVLVTPTITKETQFHFMVVWQDTSERPAWIPEELIIESEYPLHAGEIMSIGLIEPSLMEATHAGRSDGTVPEDRIVTVEIAVVAHGCFCQQTDEDRRAGIGFADLSTELQVRKATQNTTGDVQRFLARERRN